MNVAPDDHDFSLCIKIYNEHYSHPFTRDQAHSTTGIILIKSGWTFLSRRVDF